MGEAKRAVDGGSLRCSLINESNVLYDDGCGGPAVPTDSNTNGKREGYGPSEPDMSVTIFTNGPRSGKGGSNNLRAEFETSWSGGFGGVVVTLVMMAMAIAGVYFGDMRTGFSGRGGRLRLARGIR